MCFKSNLHIKTIVVDSGMLLLGTAQAEFGVSTFPNPPATGLDIYDVHMLTMQIATFLLIIVSPLSSIHLLPPQKPWLPS